MIYNLIFKAVFINDKIFISVISPVMLIDIFFHNESLIAIVSLMCHFLIRLFDQIVT